MIDRYSNISYSEKIFCHIRYWKDFIEMTNSVKKAFENSNLVLWNVFNNKLPFKAKLQNGKEIELRSFNALYLVSKVYKIEHITFDDNDDEFKEYQKEFRKLQIEKAEDKLTQEKA